MNSYDFDTGARQLYYLKKLTQRVDTGSKPIE